VVTSRQPSGAVGFHGPSMTVASVSPGQRGIVMQRNWSESPPVQRYWNAVPTGMSMETPLPRTVVSSPVLSRRHSCPSPERTCQNSLTVAWTVARFHLTWRDGGVDHVAGLAFDQVPDLGPGRGAAIRGGRERAGLHGASVCFQAVSPTDASEALGLRVSFPHAGRGSWRVGQSALSISMTGASASSAASVGGQTTSSTFV
jgi:hypothetical protein